MGEYNTITYTVKVLDADEQEITVVNQDDDYTRTSIYIASPLTVKPVYSRVLGVGHFMGALPYAFAISLMLYSIGWIYHRKVTVKKDRSA